MVTFENWRTISEYPNYQVSNIGRVMNIKTTRILKACINGTGYPSVTLSNNLGVKTNFCHRLVAREFIDNPNNKLCVDHIDRNKLNNNIDNLRWVTHQENMNQSKTINTTSKYKGVSLKKGTVKWIAQIRLNNKIHYIGVFKNEKDAAIAYNKKASELFGEFASLNVVTLSAFER